MARYEDAFGEWVSAVMDSRKVASRQVEIRTGISSGTIQSMMRGKVPGGDLVIKFAASYGESVPDALRLAGYYDLAETWETGAAPTRELIREREEGADSEEFEGIRIAGWREVDPAKQRMLEKVVRAMIEDDDDEPITGRRAED